MKLQKSTWFLVAIALVLSGVVYVNEIEQPQRERTAEQLFDFEEEEIQGLVIEQSEQTLEFERNDADNSWQMKQPQDVPASDAAVSFLLNLLVQGESDRSFTISLGQEPEYGLDTPQAEIQVELENGQHQLVLGNPTFDNRSVYAQVNSANQNSEEITILLLPIDFQYAVERELVEWQQPDNPTENE